jgi:hypothetical protein
MKAWLVCLVTIGIYAAQPSTYERDRAKERIAYAEAETKTAEGEDRSIAFIAQGKLNTTLLVVTFGGPWTTEVVDSYLNNAGRMKEMRQLGFRGIAFAQVKGEGKKVKTNMYAAFEFKRN